ncbi:enoyl-CoA hydratase/isomerase family protein [Dietzia aurantiaca]|uniref:Enoyl-CoA hydratase/isomerase family protein n=1 Tax=Dietzia aurantiaca TaxID=983873 RepID=A0ABV9PU53_9ACTN
MTEYTTLLVEEHDGILHIRLNRPDRLNAFDGPMHRELTDLIGRLRRDCGAGAVVLSGVGRAFSAGGDADWIGSADEDQLDDFFADGRSLIEDLVRIEVPVIAAVTGPVIGLGATLALFADIVVADETAVFADPHVGMGVVAGDGGAVIWPLLMGLRAKRFLLTGDRLDARAALQFGLIDEVVATGAAIDTAVGLARRLADGPREAIAGTKATANRILLSALDEALQFGIDLERQTLRSADHRAAVARFRERNDRRTDGAADDA